MRMLPLEKLAGAYLSASVVAVGCCLARSEHAPPALLPLGASLLQLLASPSGQLALANLLMSACISCMCGVTRAMFGALRPVEARRFADRLLHYAMAQLVILGAVVEPDWTELILWATVSALAGVHQRPRAQPRIVPSTLLSFRHTLDDAQRTLRTAVTW